MNYRLICSDIDGTLLNKERELSPATIAQIARLRNEIPVILVSSRMPGSMRKLQDTLGIREQALICYNGGLILDRGHEEAKILFSQEIENPVLDFLIQQSVGRSFHTSLYSFEEWYVPELDFWANREINNTKMEPVLRPLAHSLEDFRNRQVGSHKIMCMGEAEEIDFVQGALQEHFAEELNLYRSKPTYLEIGSKKTSKAKALEILLMEQFDFGAESVMAFGDNYNDMDMLEYVGWGVAVANAKEEVLRIANEVAGTSKEDGVALMLERHFSLK